MAMTTPRYFYAVAGLSLLWSLSGVGAFISQHGMDTAELAKTDPYTAKIFAQMPRWTWAAYAIAVGAGTLGAIALLLKRAWAAPLFALSVIAVIVQFGYTFLGTDMLTVKGPTTAIFPAVILILAIAQFLFARTMVSQGVLK
jgi:hypothetical protein